MPSVTLHLVLADRVLERWLDTPQEAPFDPNHPSNTNAFFQGAFGPDLGYFPGGYPLLSELSHFVQSGDLARALLHRAHTPAERAFAWGWVTHVLADQQVHPLVGRAVGEFLYGDRNLFADGARHPAAHVQVETGLDAFFSGMFPNVRGRRMAPVFDVESIGFLQGAYRDVYGITVDSSVFLASHLAVARKSCQGLMTIGVLSAASTVHSDSAPGASARWLARKVLAIVKLGLGRHPLAKAFLSPTPPAEWLIEGVEKVLEGFPDAFDQHYRTGLRELENFNLDTGGVQEETPMHTGTVRVLESLAKEGIQFPHSDQDTGQPVARLSPAA